MVSVVHGAERMAEGVDGAEAFLKGGGAPCAAALIMWARASMSAPSW